MAARSREASVTEDHYVDTAARESVSWRRFSLAGASSHRHQQSLRHSDLEGSILARNSHWSRGSFLSRKSMSETTHKTKSPLGSEGSGGTERRLTTLILGETRKLPRKGSVIHEISLCRARVTALQESTGYKIGMGIIIFMNVCLMVREVDITATGSPVPEWMKAFSAAFTVSYLVDLILKVYSVRIQFFASFLNYLDGAIVAIDLVTIPLASFSDTVGPVSILRTFRVLRIVKVLNSILAFRELYLMMQGLVSALRSIAFGTAMIFLMLTVWSILAVLVVHPKNVELAAEGRYGDCMRCPDAFATVMSSNLTFLQTIIAGDSWGLLALPLMETHPLTSLILVPAFLTVELGLVNVIAAVIVDRQQQARVDDETLTHAEHLEDLKRSYSRLRALFVKMDEDGGGSLTLDEIMESYEAHTEFREMLEMMDISKNDIPLLFEILDTDHSGDVTYQEFVEKLHYIRHINGHTLLVFVQAHLERLVNLTVQSNEKLTSLEQNANMDQEARREYFAGLTGTVSTPRTTIKADALPGCSSLQWTPGEKRPQACEIDEVEPCDGKPCMASTLAAAQRSESSGDQPEMPRSGAGGQLSSPRATRIGSRESTVDVGLSPCPESTAEESKSSRCAASATPNGSSAMLAALQLPPPDESDARLDLNPRQPTSSYGACVAWSPEGSCLSEETFDGETTRQVSQEERVAPVALPPSLEKKQMFRSSEDPRSSMQMIPATVRKPPMSQSPVLPQGSGRRASSCSAVASCEKSSPSTRGAPKVVRPAEAPRPALLPSPRLQEATMRQFSPRTTPRD